MPAMTSINPCWDNPIMPCLPSFWRHLWSQKACEKFSPQSLVQLRQTSLHIFGTLRKILFRCWQNFCFKYIETCLVKRFEVKIKPHLPKLDKWYLVNSQLWQQKWRQKMMPTMTLDYPRTEQIDVISGVIFDTMSGVFTILSDIFSTRMPNFGKWGFNCSVWTIALQTF